MPKGQDQDRKQQSQKSQPPPYSQKGSSKGSAPYSSAPQSGWREDSRFEGTYFLCGQLGHRSRDCPQKTFSGPSRSVVMSEPTVGDAGHSHRVFTVVDNRQAKHQGTVVETTGILHSISTSVLFDSGALYSFISPYLVQRCGLVAVR
jgi:hypothetical protein